MPAEVRPGPLTNQRRTFLPIQQFAAMERIDIGIESGIGILHDEVRW